MNPSGHAFGGSSRCPDCHQCIIQGVDVGAAEQVFRPGGRVVGPVQWVDPCLQLLRAGLIAYEPREAFHGMTSQESMPAPTRN